MLKMLHYVCISEPLIKWVKTYGGVELVFFVYYIVSFSGKQSPRTSGNLSATNIFYDYCRNLSHKNLPFLGEKERIKLYVCMFFEKVWIYWASQVALVVKNLPAQCRRHKRRGLNPWVRKTPRRRVWQPTPVLFLENPHGPRNLEGYSPWGHKQLDRTEAT